MMSDVFWPFLTYHPIYFRTFIDPFSDPPQKFDVINECFHLSDAFSSNVVHIVLCLFFRYESILNIFFEPVELGSGLVT